MRMANYELYCIYKHLLKNYDKLDMNGALKEARRNLSTPKHMCPQWTDWYLKLLSYVVTGYTHE